MSFNQWQIIDLDGAWESTSLPAASYLQLRDWGTQLRYCAPAHLIETFYRQLEPHLTPFTLTGSGDFHHLTGLFIRQIKEPFILVSFDNHPDWDIRPPRWCCGTWISRALELDHLQRVSVWGCANFELNFPHRLFANHTNLRTGRLEVQPWAERFHPSAQRRWPGINRDNWRQKFSRFAKEIGHKTVYVTIDMDCFTPNDAVTDWEQGLFTAADVAWALTELRAQTNLIAGDICGAHSKPYYSRWTQRFTAKIDHPKFPAPDPIRAKQINQRTLEILLSGFSGLSSFS